MANLDYNSKRYRTHILRQVIVDSMTFRPLPSPHQELCLKYIFISKLCNCLRNAHNSVAVLDEKKKNKQTRKEKDKLKEAFFERVKAELNFLRVNQYKGVNQKNENW